MNKNTSRVYVSALLGTSRKITRFNCLTPEHGTAEFVVALPHGRPSTRSMPLSWCFAWLHDNASTYRTCRGPLDAHRDRFLVLCALHMISLHVAARSTPPVAMTARIAAYTRRRPNGCQLTPPIHRFGDGAHGTSARRLLLPISTSAA